MTGTANFSQHQAYEMPQDPRISSYGFTSDAKPDSYPRDGSVGDSRESMLNPLRTHTEFMTRSQHEEFSQYPPPANQMPTGSYRHVPQWEGHPQQDYQSSEYTGESDESYESEEEEEESEQIGSSDTSSLSNYEMNDEMKGFYKKENLIDPARSSMAS